MKELKKILRLSFIFMLLPACSELAAGDNFRKTVGLNLTAQPTKIERFNVDASGLGPNPFRPVETDDSYADDTSYGQEPSPRGNTAVSSNNDAMLASDTTISGASAKSTPVLSFDERFKKATSLVQKGNASGAQMMKQLAAQGYSPAQYNLAVMYLTGRGVPKDQNQGVAYLRKAADNGHVKASSTIGAMYLQGKGVGRNPSQARRYLTKAAQKGDSQSILYLSLMYNRGDGVQQDMTQAYQWLLSLPSSSNSTELQTKLNQFKQKLSPAQQKQAQSQAQAFKARYNIR